VIAVTGFLWHSCWQSVCRACCD